MSEKNKKSPLEEAKLNYEEMLKFAEEQAAENLKEQVTEKIKQLFEEKLNEDITITLSPGNCNISGGDVSVSKDGEVIAQTSDSKSDTTDMGLDASTAGMEIPAAEDEEGFMVSDEEDEIALDETEEIIQTLNMEEMNNMQTEQDAAATTAPAPAATTPIPAADATAPAPADATAPVEAQAAPSMPDLMSKLDTLINVLLQQQGAPAEGGATAGTEQEFEVIDDEAGAAPAATPAPTAETTPAPVQEDDEIEIVDFEGEKNYIDTMEEQMIEIVDEDNNPVDGEKVDETRSLGFTSKRTGDKNLKMDTMEKNKGHHAPVTSLKESDKNKAQHESNLDELIKENSGLKNKVKELQAKEKEFEEAFVDLRTQFNEMQLFNGKLALVNKVLMNGGLTTEEKIKICEQFDSVQTYEEASKLFKNIIKENNIKIVDNGKEKLKATTTNTAKPKSTTEPLYESDEARRAKKLAGITKIEDEE